jgi:hypothetical protein
MVGWKVVQRVFSSVDQRVDMMENEMVDQSVGE